MPFTMPWAYVMRAGLGLGSLRDASDRCVFVVLVVVMRNSFALWKIDALLL
jgi:hypothetical protein